MIKVFEAFSGIGTQRMALRNLGIEHEVVAIAEIDKYALKSYEAIHGDCPNLGDISKIETTDIPNHDLFTYSFPCQDISVAGKQKGLDMDSGTRSGLLWECQKVIAAKKPKYLLMENVKNLVGKKHKHNFDKWLEWLEELGYTNYWQILNAKDYGVPQNRERVFCISILGDHEPYIFPKSIDLELRLKDVLEDEVDEKFYLSKEKTEKLTLNMEKKLTEPSDKINQIGRLDTPTRKNSQRCRTYDENGIAPSIQTMQDGNLEPQVIQPTKEMNDGSLVAHALDASYYKGKAPNDVGKGRRTHVIEGDELKVVEDISDKFSFVKKKSREIIAEKGTLPEYYNPYNKSEIGDTSPTITTSSNRASNSGQVMINRNFRIRKLTPKECWRLMGCSDEDFHKAEQVNSNTQLYKQAGNAIVVDVLEAIFSQLFLKEVANED
ncbi:DNA cytosine methyltransferase [Streptococcus dysgalactiae]|uniref:DNA cytosine methyltransferase n=1 Tax=Streptococcus dysgalactiae TaxID=1334 RepID=UPI000651D7A4|nr:DNA cytosine methyltransferase [Streptococcus dysgalactiae]